MAINVSLEPLSADQFGLAQARHLLSRAGFGGTPGQIRAIQKMGLDRAVAYLVDYESIDAGDVLEADFDPDVVAPLSTEERLEFARARRDAGSDPAKLEQVRSAFQRKRNMMRVADRNQMASIRRWWLSRMISTPRPLEEKLTLFWHGHFASNHRSVRDGYLMVKQNELFRKHANGNFAELARGIIRDPAMIVFLNNNRNVSRKPNENLARELMELFTLGEGNYSEKDIKEGARALTGYTYRDNDFVFAQRLHDDGAKTLHGKTGRHDGDAFVDLCLDQPSCPAFICSKLYRFFVCDAPESTDSAAEAIVNQLAAKFKADRFELKGVLKKLFKSQHFYDPAIVNNMIKSPAQLTVGAIRTLNTPVRDLTVLSDAMNMMGQQLFDPPTVAGWDGGRNWINTSTMFVRQNTLTYLITGKLPYDESWTKDDVDYDPMFLLDGLESPTAKTAVKHLAETIVFEDLHPQRIEQLERFISEHGGELNKQNILATILLITALPEFQLH